MSREFYEDRRARRNARIARGRFFKNLFIWILGVLFIPTVIVVATVVIPLKTFTGSDGRYVSAELAEQSLFNVTMTVMKNPGAYGVEDFPVILDEIDNLMDITVFEETKIKDLISLDKEKLRTVKFGENLGDNIIDCFKVTATIESVGVADKLGDFGELSVFKQYTAVAGEVDEHAEGFNYKLYYYKVSGDTYAPAFEKNGETVTKVSGTAELYYPNLTKVPLTDIPEIFSDSMSTVTVKSLLATFGVPEDGEIAEVFGDKTLNDLADFSFDDIKLSTFLSVAGNEDIYDILCAAVEGEVTPATLTVGDLKDGIVIDNVKLSVLLSVADNGDLYDILCGAIGGGVTPATLTVGNLKDIEIDNIKISSFLPVADNGDLYDILCNAITKDATHPLPADLTVGDLKLLEVDDVKLSSFLDPDDSANDDLYEILLDALAGHGITDKNEISLGDMKDFDTSGIKLVHVIALTNAPDLYSILEDVTGKAANAIVLSDLDGFSTGNIKLAKVLDPADAPDLYSILEDVTGKAANAIVLSDLDGFSTGNIKLANVLDPAEAPDLYSILEDVTGKAANAIVLSDLDGFSTGNIKLASVLDPADAPTLYTILGDVTGKAANAIVLSDLDGFDTDNIYLSHVLTPSAANANLYDILEDATGKSSAEIKLSDLDSGFTVDNIKLSSVISSDGGNQILAALLNDNTVTIGNLPTKINSLKVADIFDVVCFTTDSSEAADTDAKYSYNSATKTYTLDNAGTYYISKNAKVWLFMLYDGSAVKSTEAGKVGSALSYTDVELTFNGMEGRIATVSTAFTDATLKQLIQTGVIVDKPSYSSHYDKSFTEILDLIP